MQRFYDFSSRESAGQLLKRLRTEMGFRTQYSLADYILVQQTYISRWESLNIAPPHKHSRFLIAFLDVGEEEGLSAGFSHLDLQFKKEDRIFLQYVETALLSKEKDTFLNALVFMLGPDFRKVLSTISKQEIFWKDQVKMVAASALRVAINRGYTYDLRDNLDKIYNEIGNKSVIDLESSDTPFILDGQVVTEVERSQLIGLLRGIRNP